MLGGPDGAAVALSALDEGRGERAITGGTELLGGGAVGRGLEADGCPVSILKGKVELHVGEGCKMSEEPDCLLRETARNNRDDVITWPAAYI